MSEMNKINYNGTEYDIGGSGSGLTNEVKQALLACFEKVAWIDEDGQDYYDALEAALYPPANLVSISCVYTQSGTVYNTDTLDNLKSDLVVTAHYDDSSTEIITTYTLSGILAVGTSVITVSYGGKTTTFNVTVTYDDASKIYDWDFTQSLIDSKAGVTASLGAGVSRSSSGLTFDGTDTGWVYLANMSDYASIGFTVEFDVGTVKRMSNSQGRMYLFTLDGDGETMSWSTLPDGLQYVFNKWGTRLNGTDDYWTQDLPDLDTFDGATVKIQFDPVNNTTSFYKNGSLLKTASRTTNKYRIGFGQGRAENSLTVGNGTIVTGVRVYEGVV